MLSKSRVRSAEAAICRTLCLTLLVVVSLSAASAECQVYYQTARGRSVARTGAMYYDRQNVVGVGGPQNITWYNVGGGYSSSLQTGLPWRRRMMMPEAPQIQESLPEASNGSVARSSRVTTRVSTRDYYARHVNRWDLDPTTPPRQRFEQEIDVAGGVKAQPERPVSTQPPSTPVLENASSRSPQMAPQAPPQPVAPTVPAAPPLQQAPQSP